MGSITIFLKKHTLWVGFLAVLAPLLVMLGLQFAWLARLKQVSALAQKAAHNNYLEAIGTEAQFYYRSTAERALNIPASLFRQNRLGEVAVLWKKKPVEGVRRLFLVDFSRKELLPSIVKKALPAFFPGIGAGDLAVSVRDASGRVVLATGREGGDPHDGERVSATSRFPFVFADWTMSLHSPGTTPEQWASANFAFNVTLSLLLAVVLVGGIALALRAADRAVRLSGMKSDFVSNVSHELRTPLASIRVFAELLRLGRVHTPEKVQEYGEYIEAESRPLSRLIDNILDFSRIESGREGDRVEGTELCEVVAAALRTFQAHLRHGGGRGAGRGGGEARAPGSV